MDQGPEQPAHHQHIPRVSRHQLKAKTQLIVVGIDITHKHWAQDQKIAAVFRQSVGIQQELQHRWIVLAQNLNVDQNALVRISRIVVGTVGTQDLILSWDLRSRMWKGMGASWAQNPL